MSSILKPKSRFENKKIQKTTLTLEPDETKALLKGDTIKVVTTQDGSTTGAIVLLYILVIIAIVLGMRWYLILVLISFP